MLDSVNIGFSGLSTFSEGLRNISNNVANMNSNGYKGTTLQFSDLFYKLDLTANGQPTQSHYSQGSGVGIGFQGTNFAQGELRSTGSTTDLAIDGNGFFVLRQDGKQVYTRNGHFDFDSAGYLIDSDSGARVAGLADTGELIDINISSLMRNPAKATSSIKLSGVLNRGDSNGTVTTLTDGASVIDASGSTTHLKVTLTKVADVVSGQASWTVNVQNDLGATLLSAGDVRFQGDGTPVSGFNSVSFSVTPAGGPSQTLTLDFGTPGDPNGSVLAISTVPATTTGSPVKLNVASQDGYGLGELQKKTFDTNGQLTLSYTNGQKTTGARVALAMFDDLQALTRGSASVFINETDQRPKFGVAGTGGFGNVQGGKLEASNVDLASQFSQLIIIQRGYQSSSQVLGAANEMAQQVIELVKR